MHIVVVLSLTYVSLRSCANALCAVVLSRGVMCAAPAARCVSISAHERAVPRGGGEETPVSRHTSSFARHFVNRHSEGERSAGLGFLRLELYAQALFSGLDLPRGMPN